MAACQAKRKNYKSSWAAAPGDSKISNTLTISKMQTRNINNKTNNQSNDRQNLCCGVKIIHMWGIGISKEITWNNLGSPMQLPEKIKKDRINQGWAQRKKFLNISKTSWLLPEGWPDNVQYRWWKKVNTDNQTMGGTMLVMECCLGSSWRWNIL